MIIIHIIRLKYLAVYKENLKKMYLIIFTYIPTLHEVLINACYSTDI